MADPHEDQVDTDYSGRPYRLPTVEELTGEMLRGNPPPPDIWDIVHELPDGRIAVLVGGRYYITHPDGKPGPEAAGVDQGRERRQAGRPGRGCRRMRAAIHNVGRSGAHRR